MHPNADRAVGLSLVRGFRQRCPHCGEGPLFYRYLKVNPDCPACGLHLDRYPSDDGPAYFTILLVGHLVIAPTLLFPIVWQASPWIVAPILLTALAALTLLLLPRIKGAVVGLLYAHRVHREDAAIHTADQAD